MPHHQVIITNRSGKKRIFYWAYDGPTDEFLRKLSRQSSTIAVVYLICGVEVESYHRERRSNGELVA